MNLGGSQQARINLDIDHDSPVQRARMPIRVDNSHYEFVRQRSRNLCRVLLQHQPHGANIISRKASVALDIKIANLVIVYRVEKSQAATPRPAPEWAWMISGTRI